MSDNKQAEAAQDKQYDWESRYKDTSIPWDSGLPAPELEEYFAGLAKDNYPKHVFEIGCGTGTNAIWLAERGCLVATTEIAPTALESAKQKAIQANQKIDFHLVDICESMPIEPGSQDFAFDRGVYHIIGASKRPLFVERVSSALKPGALWLSISGCKDEHRERPEIGPPQMSAIELLTPVEPYFAIVKLERTYFVLDDNTRHLAWKALYQKR